MDMQSRFFCLVAFVAILIQSCSLGTLAPSELPLETVVVATPSPIGAGPSPVFTSDTIAENDFPPGMYINTKYQFGFDIPDGWELEEVIWDDELGSAPLHSVILRKDFYEIILQFKTVFEEVFIGPRGMAYGEIVKLDEIPILDRSTPGYALVADGKRKMILYPIRSEELHISSVLWMITGPDLVYTYEDIDLPEEIQVDFTKLLGGLIRTGKLELPDSVALLANFPVILPLEKIYYSQLYDTDVANACGPAAALMVLDFFGLQDSLDVVIEELKKLPSAGAYDPGCYENTVCTSPDALAMLLYEYGLGVDSHEYWTLEEIFAVVSKGNPVVADILWEPGVRSLGHFVVIYGVDLSEELLYYHDPYRGREMTSSWEDFALAWEGLVDVGDPLRPEGHRFWGLEVRATQSVP
jgi:hypothetical protein